MVEETWEAMSPWMQASLLAYDQLRQYEDSEREHNFHELLVKCMGGSLR